MPHRLDALDTPAVVVDLSCVEANLARAQAYADEHGLALWPHVKTHKLPQMARRQLDLGAAGITCQKLGEAAVMADAGLGPIFLPYNLLGAAKLARLRELHDRTDLSVTADNPAVVAGYGAALSGAGRPLPVLVECDTGGGRCGVPDPAAAVTLGRTIDATPGLQFGGLMTYPPRGAPAAVNAWLTEARDACLAAGLPVHRISNGGSPDFRHAHTVTAATEHRPGTYIYMDRQQVAFGAGTLADCALTVLATVVSRPTADRAVLDTGSKSLAADPCTTGGHGHIVGYPDATIVTLNEEHGIVDLSASAAKPAVGERVRVIPNHVCVVSNLFDRVFLTTDGETAEAVPVAARGTVQ